MKIVIEAGHGGQDSGAVGANNRYEKNDNLQLAKAIAEDFKRVGWEVVLTRTTDITISNTEKCKIENNAGANCTIAIHRNGSTSPLANGFEIWVHSNADQKIMAWGSQICAAVATTGMQLRNGGCQKGITGNPSQNYYWNSGTKSPSMLIEFGFITSDRDNKLFDENLSFYAQSVVKATCAYMNVPYIKVNPQTGGAGNTAISPPTSNSSGTGNSSSSASSTGTKDLQNFIKELDALTEKYR